MSLVRLECCESTEQSVCGWKYTDSKVLGGCNNSSDNQIDEKPVVTQRHSLFVKSILHTHTHTHTYIYIYIYVCVCVCMCAFYHRWFQHFIYIANHITYSHKHTHTHLHIHMFIYWVNQIRWPTFITYIIFLSAVYRKVTKEKKITQNNMEKKCKKTKKRRIQQRNFFSI